MGALAECAQRPGALRLDSVRETLPGWGIWGHLQKVRLLASRRVVATVSGQGSALTGCIIFPRSPRLLARMCKRKKKFFLVVE